ncbi:hypothetical protein BT69DRAFT_829306 [Atractiella rhizophila]|nr:hypothetical protein BT69DRAFT_829306 [Atractiella rhizophila]
MCTYDVRPAARFAAQCAVWQLEQLLLILTSLLLSSTKRNMSLWETTIQQHQSQRGFVEKEAKLPVSYLLGQGLLRLSRCHTMAQVERRAVKEIVEDCSRVANQVKMMTQEQRLGYRYHRFSVHTVGSIKWEEWERTQVVVGRTKAYIDVMGHEARHAANPLILDCSSSKVSVAASRG